MSALDVAVNRELSVTTPGTKIFRYVDDYLLLHDRDVPSVSIEQVFSRHSRGLNFTKEEPAAEGLQFLDLRLQTTPSGLCWSFQQRSQKPVLPFTSHHSKNVKSGIVNSLLSSSCAKSCPHLSHASLSNQINRVKKAGYPLDLIATTLKALISKSSPDRKKTTPPKKILCNAVLPQHVKPPQGSRQKVRRRRRIFVPVQAGFIVPSCQWAPALPVRMFQKARNQLRSLHVGPRLHYSSLLRRVVYWSNRALRE